MHSPRSTRWMLAAAFALALTGCATIRAQQAEQARWQVMADQVNAHYGTSSVRIELRGSGLDGSVYYRNDRHIEFGSWRGWEARAIFAHELSHHLLGHRGPDEQAELAANAKAGEVMGVWGMSQREAFLMLAWWRRGVDADISGIGAAI